MTSCTTWDPETLHSPHKNKWEQPEISNLKAPFEKAKALAIEIPLRETMTDGYIDDAISYAVQVANNVLKAQNALPLSVHTVFRPTSPPEIDIREDVLSLRKLEGDGTPSEEKLVLGWILNTRSLTVHLPTDKAIQTPTPRVKSKVMESTIGRLNHIGYILPHARYFLNRLRKLLRRCTKYGPQLINTAERKGFELWIKFIEWASQQGVSFNLISTTTWDIGI